jgi:DNA-binding Lrp family transcriptional regulator
MAVAFVLLNVNLGTEGEVMTKLREIEGVKGAYQVFGVYDIMAKIEAEDAAKLKDVLQGRLRRLGNVRSTLTLMAV